jgi:hypothetical protein
LPWTKTKLKKNVFLVLRTEWTQSIACRRGKAVRANGLFWMPPARGCDSGFSSNLPPAGQQLIAEHGWPARPIVSRQYAWKSAKRIAGLELIWERNAYHIPGDPWKEERFGW